VLASLGAQARTAYVVYTCLPFDELLRHALDDFGVRARARGRAHLLRALADFVENCAASGQLVVLIIDEAQSLPDDTFEELHLLLDVGAESRGRLQIILLGQPELDERLRAPQLRPIAERVAVRVDLKPLDQARVDVTWRIGLRTPAGRSRCSAIPPWSSSCAARTECRVA